MTEEGGSEQLGTLEVAIAGSLSPLEAALAKAEQMLADFDKKFGSTTAKAGRAAGKQGRAARTAAADAAPASAASDAPRGPINVNIKTDGLKNSINEELGGEFKIKIVTDEIQVKIDQQFLRAQVLEAFRGLNLNLGADVAGAGRAFNAGTQPQGAPQPGPRVFPAEVTKSLNQIQGLGDAIGDLYEVLNTSLRASGKEPVGNLQMDDSALDKMAEIAERFNLSSGKLVEYVDKETGKPGKVTGGVFGPTSPAIAGLDPADIRAIGQTAKTVSELSKGSRFLSQFFEALPNVQREQPRQAPYQPPQGQATASNIGEAVAGAIREERPASAPAEEPLRQNDPNRPAAVGPRFNIVDLAERAQKIGEQTSGPGPQRAATGPSEPPNPDSPFSVLKGLRDDLKSGEWRERMPVREQPVSAGTTGGGIAGTGLSLKDIIVPARLAKPGETVLESLQAAKRGAGSVEGIQGGLGGILPILQYAERGGFQNIAEIQKNGRPTGEFQKYDPFSVEGARVAASHREQPLGEEMVKRVNPLDALKATLVQRFPGIEERFDPTDPMSSLLERILAGPGRQAVKAGRRLAQASKGYNPEFGPNQTSEEPAGGPFTGGTGTSTGSLRKSYQEEQKEIENDPRIVRARRAEQEALFRVEEAQGRVVAARKSGADSADALGDFRDATIALQQIRAWGQEARESLQRERQQQRGANARQTNAENREMVAEGRNAEGYVGDIRRPGLKQETEAAATREKMASGELPGFGGYLGLVDSLKQARSGSFRSVQLSGLIDKLPPGIRTEASGTGGFSESVLRKLFDQQDEEIYDALGLKGKARKIHNLPDYIQSERSTARAALFGTPIPSAAYQKPGTRDRGTIEEREASSRPDFGGGRRTTTRGGTRTGVSTPGGAAEFIPEPVRPTTALDIERQGLLRRSEPLIGPYLPRRTGTDTRPRVEVGVEAEARRIAERRLAKIEADRKASGVAPELLDKLSVEDILYAPPTRSARASDTKSPRRIKSNILEEVKTTTDVGRRYAEIEAAQESARKAVMAINPTFDIETARGLINFNSSLTPEARQEAQELLQSRYQEAVGPEGARPKTSAAPLPTTGDEDRERLAKAGGVTPPGETGGQPPFSGYNARVTGGYNDGGGGGGGGVGVGGPRGRDFVPGGAPIEVIVVGKFPLPVEVVGGAGGGEGGSPRPGKRSRTSGRWRTSVEWIPEDELDRKDTKPPAPKPPPVTRLDRDMARGKDEFESPRSRGLRRKNLNARDVGTAVDPNRVYTFEPIDEEAAESRQRVKTQRAQSYRQTPASAAERDFLAALQAANPSLTDEQEIRRRRSRQRVLASESRIADPEGFANEQDNEDEAQKRLRGQLRILNRRIPRRGFGASLTDLLSTGIPGLSGSLEKQLEFGDLANREAAEISRVASDRARTRTTIRTLDTQIGEARRRGDTERENVLTGLRQEQVRTLTAQNKVIELSTKRFGEFYGEATKASTVLKSFGAAAIGGAAAGGLGSLQFALGSVLAGPIMAAFQTIGTEVLGPAVDRIFGFQGVTSRVTGELAQQARANAGQANIAFAQKEAQTGLGPTAAAQIRQPITDRAQIEAGNQALQEQLDLFRAAQKIRAQGGPEAALSNNLSGFLGLSIGGQPSAEETINKLFDDVSTGGLSPASRAGRDRARADIEGQIATLNQQRDEAQQAGIGTGILDDQIKGLQDRLADIDKTFDALNTGTNKGAEALEFFSKQAKDVGADIKAVFADQISDADRTKQVAALKGAGLNRFATDVEAGRLAFTTQSGQAITNPQQFIDQLFRYVTSAPKPSPEALIEANRDAISAQAEARFTRLRLQTQTLLPTQVGIEGALNPLPGPGVGINTEGLNPTQVKAVNTELGNMGKLFAQYNDEVAKGQQQAIDFVTNGADVFGTGQKVGGLGPQAGAEFATALKNAAGYAGQIQNIQIDQITKQADYAASQYAYQIGIAKRNLQDAKALTGDIVGGNQNLGRIQREQFMLQRESQALSLELSQRQINYQVALANFQAPGLSSEEREARKQAAKIEAEYAQKQLDIQKQLFGLSGKGFEISASRNVQDLVGQLNLLEKGRVLNVETAVAEKKILYLTKLQEKENKKVEAYYSAAVEATNDVISLTQDLASQTGKSMSELARDVIKAYVAVIRGIQDNLYHAYGDQTYGNPGKAQDDVFHAQGGVFNTSGMTRLTDRDVVGEAGGETVAILSNPRPFESTGAGQIINIYVSGNTVRKDEDLDTLARKIEQRFNERGAQVGLRPF